LHCYEWKEYHSNRFLLKVGYVKLFCLSKNGKAVYYITNNLFMTFEEFQRSKTPLGESKSSIGELNSAVTSRISSLEGDFQYWDIFHYQ